MRIKILLESTSATADVKGLRQKVKIPLNSALAATFMPRMSMNLIEPSYTEMAEMMDDYDKKYNLSVKAITEWGVKLRGKVHSTPDPANPRQKKIKIEFTRKGHRFILTSGGANGTFLHLETPDAGSFYANRAHADHAVKLVKLITGKTGYLRVDYNLGELFSIVDFLPPKNAKAKKAMLAILDYVAETVPMSRKRRVFPIEYTLELYGGYNDNEIRDWVSEIAAAEKSPIKVLSIKHKPYGVADIRLEATPATLLKLAMDFIDPSEYDDEEEWEKEIRETYADLIKLAPRVKIKAPEPFY